MNQLNTTDYEKLYNNQTGGLDYYRGLKFQSGYGFFGRYFTRYGIPILKFLGKEAFKTGINVINDISQGSNPKLSLKRRLKERGKSILDKVLNETTSQTGSGAKKRIKSINKHKKSNQMKRKIVKKSKIIKRRVKEIKSKKPLYKKTTFKRKRLRRSSKNSLKKYNFLDQI